MVLIHELCECGSGEYPTRHYDGYNIYLCTACTKCWSKKLKGYRPDIMQEYQCEEPIEPED